MKIADRLSEIEKEQLSKIHSPKIKQNKKEIKIEKSKPKKEEKINWHEIMGSNNRGFYRGKGGALKRR
jgi:hypothetical protein